MGIEDIQDVVTNKAELDRLSAAGMVFEDGGLEVLADEAGSGTRYAESGAGIVVGAGVSLRVAERLNATKGNEEVKKASGGSVDGEVGDAVAPGSELDTGLLTPQVGFDAEID